MSNPSGKPQSSRRGIVLVLLATTAASVLLAGCSQSDRLFSKLGASSSSDDVQALSPAEAAGAVAQWGSLYLKNPQDPRMALGYARALKAIGSRDKALEVLKTAYQSNTSNGEVASELGRLALDMGQFDIATQSLKSAEAQGIHDWKTLSAQGTLLAKQSHYAEAQQYFEAALKAEPDAVPVINNLALAYALDGKADQAEALLRKAVASGHEDKRVRQNLALVLGLQGKFDEARQVASVDMSEQEAKANMTYLRNMLTSPTALASAKSDGGSAMASGGTAPSGDDDWQPYASNSPVANDAPVRTAAATPPAPPKVQVIKPVDEIEAPQVAGLPGAKPMPAQAAPTQGLLRSNLD
jgi:Flp pilus assembly protein TadD